MMVPAEDSRVAALLAHLAVKILESALYSEFYIVNILGH